MLAKNLTVSGAAATLYVDDVFSAYTYTGNGSTQTITNGIDLAGKGGMVWCKSRSGAYSHRVTDTIRGVGKGLVTNTTDASNTDANEIPSFSSSGFSLGSGSYTNNNADTFVSWSFRKAPKFFDVVTYTGNATNRTISHALGQEVGLIFVKRTDTTADWQVYHRSLANTEYAVLNTTAAKATGATRWNSTTATTSVFSVGTDATVNASGGTYVAYLFAHDTGTDGIVQCGSFTSDGSGNATVSLGWEPQYVLAKTSTSATNWQIVDSMRGFTYDAETAELLANSSNAEGTNANPDPIATGFRLAGKTPSQTFIYLAIRRPNKPPTLGTQVYKAIARTCTEGTQVNITGVGFGTDLLLNKNRGLAYPFSWVDRLRGRAGVLLSHSTGVEAASPSANDVVSFNPDGVTVGAYSNASYINAGTGTEVYHFFKRAPGCFDQVCYTGTGVAKTEAHNLGVVPELMIVKARDGADNWVIYHDAVFAVNPANVLLFTTSAMITSSARFNSTAPTSTVFTVGSDTSTNWNTKKLVAYLFATKAGISKCGSYTGNGSSLTLNMGFTTGARFFMVKRTDSTGDWFVFDTTRGIIAGNDGHLSLNTTAAEVTTNDSVDPDVTGLIVNQVAATNINVNAASYVYLSFA